MKEGHVRAEISIFLSFIFLFLLSLITAILQATTFQIEKNYKRGEVELAMQSVFGEYHKGMLEEFDVFTLDGTYEEGNYDITNILSRLEYYGVYETEIEVGELWFLTDDSGAPFKDQALRHMKHKYGLDMIAGMVGTSSEWTVQKAQGDQLRDAQEKGMQELDSTLAEEEVDLDVAESPLGAIEEAKGKGILNLVLKKGSEISSNTVTLEQLPSRRVLRVGQGQMAVDRVGAAEALLYGEYLMQHFSSYADEGEGRNLQYELEYLISGEGSDVENLEKVANQLVLMRIAPNYLCLLNSGSMQATLSTTALGIATAVGAPPLQNAIKQALQLAWVYAESVVDVRSLYAGNRVTLVKKEMDWQLGMTALFTFGSDTDNNDGKDMEGGLRYEEYLRALLYLEDQDAMTMRALDMVEERIKNTYGQQYFQVDGCINHLYTENTASLEGGFTYQFPMSFTYR